MDPVKTWSAVLSELELKVSRPIFAAFFSKTKFSSFENDVITIKVSNPLIKEIIESRYFLEIKSLVAKYYNKETALVFKVDGTVKKEESPGPLFAPISRVRVFEDLAKLSHLNRFYTFENFAVSSSNQMAYAAARAVSQLPGHSYNPLFLYGGVGVGKTHLMQAIGLEVLKKQPNTKVIFCTGEEFTNEIIDAIRSKTTYRFKNKFRNAQVLLIDDVQFIAGKNAVQEEFFYTFDAIYRRGSQIVFTSDRPPSEISKLEERLRSRFEGGLLIDIQQPGFELRTAILLIKARQKGFDLPMNIAQELALEVSDARRLEGSLIRVLTEAQVRKEPLSLSLVQKVIGTKQQARPLGYPLSPSAFFNAVSKHYNIKVSFLKSKTRARPVSFPRQILMYLLRLELNLSLNEIGSLLGGRDHSTVLHGVEKITSLVSSSEKVQKDLFSIKNLTVNK